MALESTSPFGASDGSLSKGRTLFSTDKSDTREPFAYPFNTSGSMSSVYNSTPHSNSVLNTSHSTPIDGIKFDLKTSLPKFEDKMKSVSCVSGGVSENKLNWKSSQEELVKPEDDETPARSDKVEHSSGDSMIKFPDLSLVTNSSERANNIEDEFSDNEDLVECGNCDTEFQTLQEYMDHTCAGNKSIEDIATAKDRGSRDLSDVESFDGKIVYNPDGSAYIIEGDSDSELDSIIDIPQKGVIIDKKGKSDNNPLLKEFPHIDNAFFVPRNPNSLMSSPFMLPHKTTPTPIMHSYRVYDLRSGKHRTSNSGENSEDHLNSKSPSSNPESSTSAISPAPSSLATSLFNSRPSSQNTSQITSVPMKPILMCFICKLSFGYAKSFISHAVNEHSMDLTSEEKDIMALKNSSAIIQGIGKDKEPLMSFLEPIKSSSVEKGLKASIPESADTNIGKSSTLNETTSVSYVYTKPKLSESFSDSTSGNQKQGKDLSIHDIREQLGHFKESANTPVPTPQSTKSITFDNRSEKVEYENKRLKFDQEDSNSNSQSSFLTSASQRFMPEETSTQSPKSFLTPYTTSQRQGFFGVCEEHPNGRVAGVECPSCDMVLSSSQSLGGHMTMMHSRNSCKTLKCPKCNWHYKYQETLEIHMKEKHPEGDQKCMYCLTNQTHPRLARGESYSCGYKPYRCEVCNYSTTTKGNLSIHMQSDKHLNNVQDLANSGGDLQKFNQHQAAANSHPPQQHSQSHASPHPSPSQMQSKAPQHQQMMQQHQISQQQQQQHPSASHDSAKKAKAKPTWRCDVCNYETNVARNLRIHMTSEKHTHNMMVLQQNMKHMQRDMQIHQMNQLVMLQQDPSFLGLSGPIPGGITFPYDGSLMMGGLPAGFGGDAPVDLSKENGISPGPSGFGADMQDVNRLFQCCVCNIYGTDALESLHQHLQHDRTKQHESENITVSNGTYMCKLCQYKTTLKANFQLHCKTDKHIQRLQLVNHIKEGGANNEWRLKYLNVSNPVQVRCNACDYYTNSIHKLQIHTGNPRHEASAQLFCHLQQQESHLSKTSKYYHCVLCKFNARSKLGLMQHVHSVQHLHSESMKQIEMKETGQMEIDIGDIFMVKEIEDEETVKFDDEAPPTTNGLVDEESNCVEQDSSDSKDRVTTPLSPSQSNNNNNNNNNTIKQTAEDLTQKGDAPNNEEKLLERPYSTYSSTNEMHLKSHVSTVPSNNLAATISCPLCQEQFSEKSTIKHHLTAVHNVNSEGLQNLLALVEEPKSKMPPTTIRDMPFPAGNITLAKVCEVNLDVLELESAKLAAEDAIDIAQNDKDIDDQFRCQTCSKTFTNIDQLYSHQNELGHLELKQTPRGPGYLCWKKGCNQYFKTAQALQMHFREIHAKAIPMSSSDKSEYKFPCQICPLAFKSQHKLHFHAQMHIVKSAVTCNLCTKFFQSLSLLSKHVETAHDLGDSELEQYRAEIYANATAFATFMTDPKLSKVFSLSDLPKENIQHSDNGKSSDGGMKHPLMENGGMESEDNSPASTPLSLENGLDKDGMEMGENEMNSKEQQFFEDYINSQAFAEGSYEDPNRKFKCHRCRVAFTKQIYLTAHNKTLMHKKGDRLSYPMEKFLDPNRPYKCDICKESFTQKNILLVHFNSVSHLHKMKQAGGEGQLPLTTGSAPSPVPTTTQSSATSMSSSTSAIETSEKSSSKKSRESSPDDESQRPYKCNICKVSYSQGSTLDIHIRSVAHQTRASKLHELAMTGEVDLSRPLIEEPLDKSLQAQQQKLLNDFLKTSMSPLSQQSLLFQGLPGMTSFPGFPGLPTMPGLPLLASLPPLLPLSLPNQVFPTSLPSTTSSHSSLAGSNEKHSASSSSTEAKMMSGSSNKSLDKISQQLVMSQSLSNGVSGAESAAAVSAAVAMATASAQSQGLSGSIHVCQKCSAVFASQESYNQHQVQCSGSSASPIPSPALGNRSRFVGRTKTAVHRNLLENFGFECVMQFNEFNQRAIKKEREEEAKEAAKENAKDNITEEVPEEKCEENGKEEVNEKPAIVEETVEKVVVKEEKEENIDLPEMNKSKCTHCGKQFSSVWVLKAHEEEVHKEIVPLEIVEEVGDQFKTDFEKKLPKELPPLEIPFSVPTTQPHSSEEKSVKQEMPPPPPPPPPQMQLDMLQMMNMFNMGMMPMPMPLLMNSQPSLMPMMMPPPGLDMKAPSHPMDPSMSPAGMSQSQKRQMEQASMANQKRARTRINDEQLKVLRGYFDINNSPAEEQIQAMSEQTGLPMKVIKHWFRNTLFKERQRNKDSPYNFNNPPSTTLDLEEYEKTGKLTIIEDSSPPMSKSPSPALKSESEIKKEIVEKSHHVVESRKELSLPLHNSGPKESVLPLPTPAKAQVLEIKPKQVPDLKQSESKHPSVPLASPRNEPVPSASSMSSSSMSPMLTSPSNSFMQNFVSSLAGMSTPNTPNYPPTSTTPNSLSNSLSHYDSHNYSPPGSGSTGRRANRTRFTDYQIKCLQEYFEQNAYPKDDELEHLSKMLGLSPRVIVVWFQNARQKARKIYENQPADNMKDASGNSPYARTAGLNYQCKKCQAVFQRYYDLIRHQKRSCFTEAEKQESNFMSDDSDSMSNVTSLDNTAFSDSESECSNLGRSIKEMNTSGSSDSKKYPCDKCDQAFNHYDQYREHQSLHGLSSMYMNLPGGGAFGMLQSMASSQQQGHVDQSPNKRKYEEEEDDQDQPRDKRLRTTILPEQLDYLYQKYQIDCNPSRKQLEAISKDVGLKKRVVQVWFQNTRARERKGQYRAHQQLIHKRCPVCRALFRAKSALESHLATKHPDEMAKGDINIDSIPDAAIESPGPSSSSNLMPPSPDYNKLLAPPAMQGLLPYMPPASLGGLGFPPMADPIQMSMKQFYEDSFKKYINELSSTSQPHGPPHKQPAIPHEHHSSTPMKSETPAPSIENDAPLDLSKPLKVATHSEDKNNKDGPTSQSSFSSGHSSSGCGPGERSRQNSGHSTVHSVLGSAVDQAYMMNRFKQDSAMHHAEAEEESSNLSSSPASPGHNSQSAAANKRYRTQMTSLQVRIMKQIFLDYKTPTMAECEMLGRVIGLQKRVVQVWFQNARAKEKKAKLNMKFPPSEMDFPKPPEECTLCNFKYSHKYTIQDHIFTKKHIDKVREFIQSQTDAEREMSSTAASMAGVSGLLRSQQANDVDHMRKLMEEANHQSQMAQLQSMGLAPLGLPPSAMAGMGLLPPDFLHGMKKDGASSKEGKDNDSKLDGSSRKESNKSGSGSSDGPLGPFGGLMPGMDPGMLPYMYPGLPGLMPGMAPIGQPGFMPGAEHLMGYDPMTYGTPLPLLQIPQQAIKDVSSKLMDPKATIGQYTQDCRSISSLRSLVSSADYNCAREATVDVGYICKKCQMVYPAKEACVAHQRLMCFPGGKLPEGVNIMLKLEQIQYDCKLCSEKVSTVQEFKSHCDGESHKTKLAVYQQQRNSGAATPKSIHSPRQAIGMESDKSSPSMGEHSRKDNT